MSEFMIVDPWIMIAGFGVVLFVLCNLPEW